MGENHWTNLIDVSDKYKGIMRAYKKRLAVDENAIMSEDDEMFLIEYDCFCHQLDLFAETCLMRNKINQRILQEFFPSKFLIDIFQEKQLTFKIRSKALKFYLVACLDIDPFKELVIPSGQAVFCELKDLDFEGEDLVTAIKTPDFEFAIKSSPYKIPPRLMDLKVFCEEFLREQNGQMDLVDMDKNDMTVCVLRTVKFMLGHGFYQNQKEL